MFLSFNKPSQARIDDKGVFKKHKIAPSRAMMIYRRAFAKHDPDGFSEFINKADTGEVKIKQERYAHAKKNRSVDYKDEELPTILYNGFNSLYGDKEDILEDHDICLTMALVSNFFEKFKQYRGERHPMVYSNDLDQFLSMIRNADLDMVKDGIVEEDEEPQYYLDMMDEYFGSDIGKNNNMDCDYHIWLFFTEKTQNILYNRVKQKREE